MGKVHNHGSSLACHSAFFSFLSLDGQQSDDLLRPVFMGCATRNAKVVAISLGSLQRLISMKAVPMTAVPLIVSIMNDCMSQGVDIQLRILQTLLSLLTNFPAIHDILLGDVSIHILAKRRLLTNLTGFISLFQTSGVENSCCFFNCWCDITATTHACSRQGLG